MTAEHPHTFPKLHNAVWPGLVGKGDGGEPPIGLDTMLDLTAAAEYEGVKFDGFDIFLYHPHFNIDGGEDEIQRLVDKARAEKPDRRHRRRTGLCRHRRRLGNGYGSGPRAFSGTSQKGLPRGRAAAAIGHAALRRGPHRLRLAGGTLV